MILEADFATADELKVCRERGFSPFRLHWLAAHRTGLFCLQALEKEIRGQVAEGIRKAKAGYAFYTLPSPPLAPPTHMRLCAFAGPGHCDCVAGFVGLVLCRLFFSSPPAPEELYTDIYAEGIPEYVRGVEITGGIQKS